MTIALTLTLLKQIKPLKMKTKGKYTKADDVILLMTSLWDGSETTHNQRVKDYALIVFATT